MVVDLLRLELPMAHVEAHRLEHAISDVLEERITQTLGDPRTCPIGHLIPGGGYRALGRAAVTPESAGLGKKLVIDRIPEEDQQQFEHLVFHGIVRGVEVEVVEVGPYRAVLTLKVGEDAAVLGLGVAGRIRAVAAPVQSGAAAPAEA